MTYEEYKKIATVEISADEYRDYVEPVYMGSAISKVECAIIYDAVKIWDLLKTEADLYGIVEMTKKELSSIEERARERRIKLAEREAVFVKKNIENKPILSEYFKSKRVVK